MFITKKSKYPIGLDISDTSLKIVQLKKNKNKLAIQALGRVDLPVDTMLNGEIKNKKNFVNALTKLLNKPRFGSLTTNEVSACLPDAKTFIKLISIEKSPNEITDVIETEMQKHIPLSLKDMYYDWQIIEETRENAWVLVGAAPKKIVDLYINTLKSVNLSPVAMEIESVAICRALLREEMPKYEGQKNNYCIIDIGASRTGIIIYRQNTIVISLSIPISGQAITDKIASSLEITKEQAEKAKIICGFDKSKAHGIINNLLSEMAKKLINRIKQTLEFYEDHYPNQGNIEKIILCGGGANIKNLDNLIEEALKIPVENGDIFVNLQEKDKKIKDNLKETHYLKKDKKIKTNKSLTKEQKTNLSYATAIGLALRPS